MGEAATRVAEERGGHICADDESLIRGYYGVMSTITEHIIKLTDHRDRDLLELTLSKALIDLLPIQRVVIARAMIMEPKFLVADEPVSMLDASVRVEILKLLSGLQKTHNLSVIYITHDLATVSYFSERIFVMYAGNLVEKGKVRQILDTPLHPYTMALLTGTSEPDAKNAETFKEIPPGEPPSLVNPPTGCRFHPRCSKIIAGLCDVEKPQEFEPEAGHLVSCWLYK